MHMLALIGPPETPTNLHVISSTTTSITVQWRKGFNGGHPQTFVVSYKQDGTNDEHKLESNETTDTHYTLAINNLEPDEIYTLYLYAYNVEGSCSGNVTLHNIFVKGNT